jgi:hypothetical protein
MVAALIPYLVVLPLFCHRGSRCCLLVKAGIFTMTNSLFKGLGDVVGSPFGLSPPAYPLSSGLATPLQFTSWNWQGASLAWYFHSIREFAETTAIGTANYIMVRRELDGRRTALYIGQSGNLGERLPNHEKFAEARRLGANELHIHFLANSASDRFSIETDLRNGHNPPE